MALEVEHTIKADVLAVRLIPNVHPDMAKALELKPGEKSWAWSPAPSMIRCTSVAMMRPRWHRFGWHFVIRTTRAASIRPAHFPVRPC